MILVLGGGRHGWWWMIVGVQQNTAILARRRTVKEWDGPRPLDGCSYCTTYDTTSRYFTSWDASSCREEEVLASRIRNVFGPNRHGRFAVASVFDRFIAKGLASDVLHRTLFAALPKRQQ